MNRFLTGLLVASLCLGGMTAEVAAKRLGGGGSAGIGRSAPAPKPAPAAPAAPVQPAAAPTVPAAAPAAPAAAPKRSWMGPLAGVAAGLGLAALLGHFGMGGELGSLVTLLVLGAAAAFALRFMLQRFGPAAAQRSPQLWPVAAGAGAFGAGGSTALPIEPPLMPAPSLPALQPGFDAPAFERVAKLVFLRMQAANDAGNLDDLRRFASPEMFATFRLDLQERRGSAQQTDVSELEAQLLGVVHETGRQVASVRFRGLSREAAGAPALPFDETWHLARAGDGDADWTIAGIEQNPGR